MRVHFMVGEDWANRSCSQAFYIAGNKDRRNFLEIQMIRICDNPVGPGEIELECRYEQPDYPECGPKAPLQALAGSGRRNDQHVRLSEVPALRIRLG